MSNRSLIGKRLREGRKDGLTPNQRFNRKSIEDDRKKKKREQLGPKKTDTSIERKKLEVQEQFSDNNEEEPLRYGRNYST
ncbi:hypothetical protein N9N26_05965 [Candidatus Poseidoniales archaeon]|jgi:hypothetical protein|nr:hypothetical protein [Candidatus Poseidoniales archaeon]